MKILDEHYSGKCIVRVIPIPYPPRSYELNPLNLSVTEFGKNAPCMTPKPNSTKMLKIMITKTIQPMDMS
jgi:hypothetical protein